MTNGCAVQQCDKPTKRRGYCYGHYMKQWRYGTPTPEWPARYIDLIGHRFGTLTVTARVDDLWACTCDCGETRITRTGDLNRTGDGATCGNKRNHLAPTVTYNGAHDRVRSARGTARTYACVDCARTAQQWSYDHDDPNQLIGPTGDMPGAPAAYSLDTDRYSPRCISCHRRFDLARIRAERADPTHSDRTHTEP